MPAPHVITGNRWVTKLGPRVKDPNLWHLNRRSVSAGVFAGVLAAFIPLPIQIFVAIFICFFSRGNLPVAVGSTWVSNPFTYIPLYYFCYELGTWLLGVPVDDFGNPIKIHIKLIVADFQGFLHILGNLGWRAIGPLLLGCTIVGFFSALSSYVVIRLLWRLHIYRAWQHRRERRIKKHQRHG